MIKLADDVSIQKLFSSAFVILVVGLLVIAGPVDALYLSLDGFKNTPYAFNEKINFIGNIEINSDEIVNLQNVSLEVNDQIVCTFAVDGTLLTDCSGVNVSLISSPGYGYGYGYNTFELGWNGGNGSVNAGNYNGTSSGYGYGYGYSNGEIAYNVTIQSPQGYLSIPGNNNLKLVAQTDSQLFNSRTEHIVIQTQNSGGNSNGSSSGNGNGNSGGSSGGNGNGNGGNSGGSSGNGNGNGGGNGNGAGNGNNGNGNNNQLLSNPSLNSVLSNQNAQSGNGITGSAIDGSDNGRLWLVATSLFFIAIGAVILAMYYRRSSKIQARQSYYSKNYY